MICNECGQILREKSKFCKKCGARINASKQAQSEGSDSSLVLTISDPGEISRDAIVIYLNNMRMIETIIYESERKKEQLLEALREKKDQVNLWEEQKLINSLEYEVSKKIHKGKIDADTVVGGIFIGAVVVGIIVLIFSGFLAGITVGIPVGSIIGAIWAICSEKKDNKRRYKAVLDEKHENEILLQQAQDKYEQMRIQKLDEYNKMKEQCKPLLNGLDRNIDHYKKIRDVGYDLNLIPYSSSSESNCRCLNGVLFLHEFMSSSRESLTTALGHYKLDKIISRLDDLIAAVNQVISNQEYIMVQQDQILDQLERNERLLERNAKHLDKINDYARISAHNSELQTEMARESLYYQRVDLFLNRRIV